MHGTSTPLRAAAIAVGMTCALSVGAQTPLLKHTFEDSDGGWTVMGTGGKVSVTHDAANVKTGKAALQLDYSVKKGDMSALMLMTPDGMLAKAKSFHMVMKSDAVAVMAVALQEQGGGRYVSMFTMPGGKWQQVDLAPSDFTLSEDGNDPPDPNGKLDLDKVEALAIIDVGQMMAQADNPELEKLLNIKRGDHILFVDDVSATDEPLASPAATPDSLDSFTRPQIGWFAVGDVQVASASGAPLTGRGIQLSYRQAPGKPIGVIRRIPRGILTGKTTFSVEIASSRPAKLLLQVEEKSGGKYNILVDVPGDKQVKTLAFPFAEFKAGDDSHDNNDKLDLDQVNQVVVVDINGLLGMAEGDNTLWIGSVKATAGK